MEYKYFFSTIVLFINLVFVVQCYHTSSLPQSPRIKRNRVRGDAYLGVAASTYTAPTITGIFYNFLYVDKYYIFPTLKLLYAPTPGTKSHAWLRALTIAECQSEGPYPSQNDRPECEDSMYSSNAFKLVNTLPSIVGKALQNEDWTRLVVERDPLERLYAAYTKLVVNHALQSPNFIYPTLKSWLPGPPGQCSFECMVDALYNVSNGGKDILFMKHLDLYFRPQAYLHDFTGINWNFPVSYATAIDCAEELFRKYDLPNYLEERYFLNPETQDLFEEDKSSWKVETIAKVDELYGVDYQNLEIMNQRIAD